MKHLVVVFCIADLVLLLTNTFYFIFYLASLAAVIVGALLSAVMVMGMTFMVFRYCRRKYKKSNSYEHVSGKAFATDSGSIPATTISR